MGPNMKLSIHTIKITTGKFMLTNNTSSHQYKALPQTTSVAAAFQWDFHSCLSFSQKGTLDPFFQLTFGSP